MDNDHWIRKLDELRELPHETEWAEFKVSQAQPETIGKYLSALSNGARLKGENFGYLIFGVHDTTREVVGTTFKGEREKAKKQPLRLWLSQGLNPPIAFDFVEVKYPDSKRVVVIEIPAASGTTTKWQGIPYIRLGEATPRLDQHSGLERKLNKLLLENVWEEDICEDNVTSERVLELLDYKKFFQQRGEQDPPSSGAILQKLQEEKLIIQVSKGHWSITNLAACVMARDFSKFHRLSRKAPRIIIYSFDRSKAKDEIVFNRGYGVGFEELIDKLMSLTEREYRDA